MWKKKKGIHKNSQVFFLFQNKQLSKDHLFKKKKKSDKKSNLYSNFMIFLSFGGQKKNSKKIPQNIFVNFAFHIYVPQCCKDNFLERESQSKARCWGQWTKQKFCNKNIFGHSVPKWKKKFNTEIIKAICYHFNFFSYLSG